MKCLFTKKFCVFCRMFDTGLDERTPALAFISSLISKDETHPFVFRNYCLPSRYTYMILKNQAQLECIWLIGMIKPSKSVAEIWSNMFRRDTPYLSSTQNLMWEAIRASTAAPTYFEVWNLHIINPITQFCQVFLKDRCWGLYFL